MSRTRFAVLVMLLALAADVQAVEETLESVTSRGVRQKFVLTTPDGKPTAGVVLFAGGPGNLSLGSVSASPTIGGLRNNFLVRTRKNFAEKGFLVATVDAPDDRPKLSLLWRMSAGHARDILAVAAFLKQKADVPLWAIGTSMGSFSAVNMRIRLKGRFRGIVLSSSITRGNPKWPIYPEYPFGILNMPLAEVTGPVLLISHQDDACPLTPAADISKLAAAFTLAETVETIIFTGGAAPVSGPCKALSPHGFLGIEPKVVDAITRFINKNGINLR